jgi:hypothetical protein
MTGIYPDEERVRKIVVEEHGCIDGIEFYFYQTVDARASKEREASFQFLI